MMALDIETRTAHSQRGEIAYQAVGSGPPVLFLGGLAAGWQGVGRQIAHLADRYRCLAWDYRGLYADRPSPSGTALSIDEHARDALAILDAEHADRAALFGWSLGVQTSLALFDSAPQRCSMLVLVSGGARAPWGRTPEAGTLGRLYPRALQWAARAPRLLSAALRACGDSPEAYTWGRRLGLVGAELDQELFAEVARTLCRLDPAALLHTLECMMHDDYSFVLPRIDVPVLVVGGDRDPFTPRAALERMVNHIPGCEYLLIPGGTHYALLDHAQHLNLRIDKFFGERGYSAQAA